MRVWGTPSRLSHFPCCHMKCKVCPGHGFASRTCLWCQSFQTGSFPPSEALLIIGNPQNAGVGWRGCCSWHEGCVLAPAGLGPTLEGYRVSWASGRLRVWGLSPVTDGQAGGHVDERVEGTASALGLGGLCGTAHSVTLSGPQGVVSAQAQVPFGLA